jgi:uncharacterized protein YlxP (DUF503 family)
MHIAFARVTLRLPDTHSLKGKRQVIKSIISRAHDRYGVSIAEVGAQETWQLAELGVAYVSGDARRAEEIIQQVIRYIEETRLDCELLEAEYDVLPAF